MPVYGQLCLSTPCIHESWPSGFSDQDWTLHYKYSIALFGNKAIASMISFSFCLPLSDVSPKGTLMSFILNGTPAPCVCHILPGWEWGTAG